MEAMPITTDSQPISLGSIGHAEGTCQAACGFILRPRGCANGVNCTFCHFTHDAKRMRKNHNGDQRPSKGKRDKYRNYFQKLKTDLEENPDSFDPDSVELPSTISTDPKLREKLVARLKTLKSDLLGGGSLNKLLEKEGGSPANSGSSTKCDSNEKTSPGSSANNSGNDSSGNEGTKVQAADYDRSKNIPMKLPIAEQETDWDCAADVPMKVQMSSFDPLEALRMKQSQLQETLGQLQVARERQQPCSLGATGSPKASQVNMRSPEQKLTAAVPPGILGAPPGVLGSVALPGMMKASELVALMESQIKAQSYTSAAAINENVSAAHALINMVAQQSAISWQQQQQQMILQRAASRNGLPTSPCFLHDDAPFMFPQNGPADASGPWGFPSVDRGFQNPAFLAPPGLGTPMPGQASSQQAFLSTRGPA